MNDDMGFTDNHNLPMYVKHTPEGPTRTMAEWKREANLYQPGRSFSAMWAAKRYAKVHGAAMVLLATGAGVLFYQEADGSLHRRTFKDVRPLREK